MAARVTASVGTAVLAALPVLMGFQSLLSFLNFYLQNVLRNPMHRSLAPGSRYSNGASTPGSAP